MRISVTAFLFISSILFACLSTSPPSDPLQYRMWHAAMLIWHDVLSAPCRNIFLARWTPCSAGPQSLTALGKWTAAEGSWAGCEPTGGVSCVWQRLWTASVTAGAAGCSHAGEPVNHFRNANSSNVWLWGGQSADNRGRGRLGGHSARRCCSATWCWSPVLAGHRPDLPPGTSRIPGSNLAPRASRSTLRHDT